MITLSMNLSLMHSCVITTLRDHHYNKLILMIFKLVPHLSPLIIKREHKYTKFSF